MKKTTYVKMTIKPPRCVRCRERGLEGDLDALLDTVKQMLLNKTGKGLPITITLVKP